MARTALILIFPNAGREYQGAFRKIMPRPSRAGGFPRGDGAARAPVVRR
jgi:hypothetical protein